ncbi:MAG: PadR family transcriptional regulator [Bacteroidetes bacterium]|nr:MAG: PadR family transcriptional regulator [Bacteroidota bacterium]
MKGTHLGEFEEIVLLTAGVLTGEAYGLSVKYEVEKRSERKVNLSAIHSALYRLERKGFLRSELGEATQRRGGKRKKYFYVTSMGMKSLHEVKDLRSNLWASLSKAVTG